ncbi:MAG TPA: hypothetical protein VGX24_16350 [Pyrinomonadaceae bacterium]|jgi:hypothetical protein|nr:hypothetical protein [Pyrinomonadaceae bacterium]
MKSYRNAIGALVLAFVFSTNAFANAGVLWTEKTPPPPPPTNGGMWTDEASSAPEEDALTEITLTLLQTLIPLL